VSFDRRGFLKAAAGALAAASPACARRTDWSRLRLVRSTSAGPIELAALDDAAKLLARAVGRAVPIVDDGGPEGALDLVVTTRGSSAARAGSFRIAWDRGRLVVTGEDAEGARNGLYCLLERLGFGFFRDGETVPVLSGPAGLDVATELAEAPAFALRGDMIWNNYLGPRRLCAGMWDESEWERALVYLARSRMNFLEFYPPLEGILARVLPEARRLSEGRVWKSGVELDLAKRVLARGRALGIRFMYVLTYGAFPEPVRALFPHLEWRNGFLCAQEPELQELTERVWGRLVEELSTDHWYAVRHRGEEDQAYGDPCRSVTKKEGFLQAFSVLAKVDPEAAITVWTWGEKLPDLFEGFPANVRAAHIRHGMAGVFGDRGEGREQVDGPPPLPQGTKWISGQFTVFSGNETLLQTAWSDAPSLSRDASASRRNPSCEGYFQWPEWSASSPWLSHAIGRISWSPESLERLEPALSSYAHDRHRERAGAFLAGFLPLLRAGNAKLTYPPRKRLLVPYFLAPESLVLLGDTRTGVRVMADSLEGAPAVFHRDLLDLLTWTALRQAQTFEVEAYLRHVEDDRAGSEQALAVAEETWTSLASVLGQVPELSIVASARRLSKVGELSDRAEDSLFTLACDFYNGYPLVLSPEAIDLVYLPQLEALRSALESASTQGKKAALDEPGWFWHDFPDRGWADAVRRLPSEDAARFENEMRTRLRDALEATPPKEVREPGRLDTAAALPVISRVLSPVLPEARRQPPALARARARSRSRSRL
jgi:hypothetical protein